jgi:hypothetical protein
MFDQMPGDGPEPGDLSPVPPPDGSEPGDLPPVPLPGPRVCWEAAPTGPATIGALAEVKLAGLSSVELLDVVTGWERQAAWLAGQQARVVAAAAARIRAEADSDYGDAELSENLVCTEIGTALRLAPSTAGRRVQVAEDLRERLPATCQALDEGTITYWQAMTIATGTTGLTGVQAQLIEARVLPKAGSTTAAGLRKRIERARLILNPRDSSDRARQALDERTVTLVPVEDGMAELRAYGPAPQLQALYHALDIVAGRTPKTDGRRMGARRFDALLDAAVRCVDKPGCPPPTRVNATVFLTLDLSTLLGLTDHPGELHGYGPLPAPLARILAADNAWYRLIHDPRTGAPLDIGTLKRKPSAGLVRWVRARDATCLFPGCFNAASRCDLDHRIRVVDHGPTNEANLAPLCPKHHRVKEAGWRYTRYPDRIVWTSPYRRTYTRYLQQAHHDLIALLAADGPEFEPTDPDESHDGHYSTGLAQPDPEGRPPRTRTRAEPADLEAHGPPHDTDPDTLTPPDDLHALLRPHAPGDISPPDDPEPPDDTDPPLYTEPPHYSHPEDAP